MPDPADSSRSKREEALLSWIQQSAPYGVVLLNQSLQVQSWNHWMEIHSGRALKDVAGRDIFHLFPSLSERNLVSPFERALNGESCVLSTGLHHYLLPFPSPQRDSGYPYMRQTARITPLLTDGVISGVIIVIEDVTQRESQAEILARQARREEMLSWALAHFLKSEEPRKTTRPLFFKIAEHLDFDTFLLYLRDVETGSLGLYTSGGIPPELERDFAGSPLFSAAAESLEIMVFNSVNARPEPEYALLKQAGVAAAVALPLVVNNRSVGLLSFATWSRDAIVPEECHLLRTIGQYLAIAVDRENANLQLKKAKEELSNHAQLLESMVAERTSSLQETVSELETFSYTLAHDLRAPVRGITGYGQILLEDFAAKLPADAIVVINRLLRASRRMEALIQDLLAFNRISREAVVLSPVNIEPLLDDLLALRLPAIRQAVTVRAPLHAVSAHKSFLQQVLSNLVDNAIKFVDAGVQPKITIHTELVPQGSPSTRSGRLLFSSTEPPPPGEDAPPREKRGKIRVWVEDNGIGIAPEAHQKIFGIFERGASSQRYEGTGMGLAIVARAVQRMGGTFGVESEPGNGSRFWIELNAA